MAQKPEQGANPLGYEPLPKLLRGYAIPSVIAMLAVSYTHLSAVSVVIRRQWRWIPGRIVPILPTAL